MKYQHDAKLRNSAKLAKLTVCNLCRRWVTFTQRSLTAGQIDAFLILSGRGPKADGDPYGGMDQKPNHSADSRLHTFELHNEATKRRNTENKSRPIYDKTKHGSNKVKELKMLIVRDYFQCFLVLSCLTSLLSLIKLRHIISFAVSSINIESTSFLVTAGLFFAVSRRLGFHI